MTQSHGNCGVRPEKSELGADRISLKSYVGVIPVCCEVWITVISIILYAFCHNVKGL